MKKKLIFFCLAIVVVIVACKKEKESIRGCTDINALNYNAEANKDDATCEYIEQVNRAAYFHFTEDWCPGCGTYGGPTFDTCLTLLEGKSISCMKIYATSNNALLNNPCATLMEDASNFHVPGWPTIFINNDLNWVNSNIASNYNSVKGLADYFATKPVVAGVHLSKSIDGSKMIVTAKIKFFNAIAAGKDFRIAIYLLEDYVVSVQNMMTGPPATNYVNRNVWRATNFTDYRGVKINANAAISAGQNFTIPAEITLNSLWNTSNLKVMAVIWEVPSTGLPKVINSNVVK